MVDIMSLVTHLLGMNDEQIGAWIRKAVNDCLEGCIREDVDKLVKECYERSLEAMKKKQEFDAQTYRRRLERQGKSANLLATTLCHTVSTEKASKEGGDTREDSLNLPDSDAPKGVGTAGGSLESGTPSLLPFTVTTTRNQLAGEITPESQDKTSLPVSLAGNKHFGREKAIRHLRPRDAHRRGRPPLARSLRRKPPHRHRHSRCVH